MLSISIPGFDELQFRHLVLDFNGTIACDGLLIEGVEERLKQLSQQLKIDIITADTHGSAAAQLKQLSVELIIIPNAGQDQAKAAHVKKRDQNTVCAIGNGRNDHQMLKIAALGIAIVQQEGVAVSTIEAADILVPNILAALDLVLKPKRLIATLRN